MFLSLLYFILSVPTYAAAEKTDDTNTLLLQQTFDDLKQQVARTANDKSLEILGQRNQDLLEQIDHLLTSIAQHAGPINTQLNILGPAPQPHSGTENEEVSNRRALLLKQKEILESKTLQATTLKVNAQQLAVQISDVRRNLLAKELSLNNNSIFSPAFWRPLFSPSEYNKMRFSNFWQIYLETNRQAFGNGNFLGSLVLLIAALLLPLFRKRLEVPITRLTVAFIPEGSMIRSFYALVLILANTALLSLAAGLFAAIYLRLPETPKLIAEFLQEWLHLCILSGLLVGIGRALISKQKPSWRLARISDSIAMALNPFPRIIAGIMFLFGTIEIFNNTAGSSVSVSVIASGMTAFSLLLCLLAMIWRINKVKTTEYDADDKQQNTSVHGVIYLLSAFFAVIELISLLTGYIGLARYLAYKATWGFIVISITFFLLRFWNDACEELFSNKNRAGRFLQRFLKLRDQNMTILSILLGAMGKIGVLVIMLFTLFYGTFGSSAPVDLPGRIRVIWSGQGIGQIHIVPSHLAAALITFLVAIWCLYQSNRWMVEKLLPNTRMAKGMQASLSTLYTNVGYAIITVMSLASLGIKWDNLAWIVSALSVGIGFGLQEIVKNFISGLILLTERPVRVGDLVSISGVEGDIKKISVRATEIQLSDRSTVIVPNSQFISQNVRNVTRGNSPGVVSISLTWPLEIDPIEIRDLLLEIYNNNDSILASPQTSVACIELSSEGITLKATGYVSSPRQIFQTKSAILLEILHQMRERKIDISVPQTIILDRK